MCFTVPVVVRVSACFCLPVTVHIMSVSVSVISVCVSVCVCNFVLLFNQAFVILKVPSVHLLVFSVWICCQV